MMRILVVDDEDAIRVSLREVLEEDGHEVLEAANGVRARTLAAQGADLALLDIRLGDEDGVELLKAFRAAHPHMPVIMITGHGTVSVAAEAFRLGAHDFMEKPLRLVKVRASIRNALESVALRHRVAEASRRSCPRAVYSSKVMRELYAQVRRLASVSEPVVIAGPSGSGKELVAQALHFEGPRADGPFVATNTASLPVTLAEDELFGHEKGAFTGAHARRKGCLEQADGGTLFLDEIGDMDQAIQAKLLRVLETGTFTRLGGVDQVTVKVRIVSATHKDLAALSGEGGFRHDLWYRLCAFVLQVPALEKRREDIPLLAQAFLERTCAEMNVRRVFSEEALEVLRTRDYPGNVRELKHVVTRAAVFAPGDTIDAAVLAQAAGGPVGAVPGAGAGEYFTLRFREARDRFESDYLRAALERHGGNITAAAGEIGMAQSNLSRKLKELGLRG
jgi:two-component system nitrogen regulation response regulator NtrX